MTTEAKAKKRACTSWTMDTQATNELIDEYIGNFQLPGWSQQHAAAAMNAAAKQCKADRSVVHSYTMKEMMGDAIYFIEGFKNGYSYLSSELNKRLLDMD